MIDFIESVMCLDSLLQVWDFVKNHPWGIILIGVLYVFYRTYRKHSMET